MRTRVMLALIAAVMIAWASFVAFIEMTPRNEDLTIAPPIAETIPLEPLTWEGERPPASDINIQYHETLSRHYFNDGSINESIEMHYYPSRFFWFWLNAKVDLITGYVHNINITAQGSTPTSQMVIQAEQTVFEAENLHVLPSSSNSSINFYGVNLPHRATLGIVPTWLMSSPDNQTEQATLTVDVVYFNGTAYRKTTCPMYLKSTGCVNTNIENAEEIKAGQTTTKRVLSYHRAYEFYKIHPNEGEKINMTAIPQETMSIYLYVYNSSDLVNPNYSSTNLFNATQNIIFTVNTTSWYFIEIRHIGGSGVYVLKVDDLE